MFALFGYVGTPTCVAALPLVNDGQDPVLRPLHRRRGAARPVHASACSTCAPRTTTRPALIVKQLTSLGLKKIAVFYQNDAYGKAGLDGVTRALKAAGPGAGRPSAPSSATPSTWPRRWPTSWPQQPDAVVQISAYKSCAAFIREARKAGYGGTFYNVSFVGTQALADELGREGRGVMVSQVMPFPFSTTTPISREYLDAVAKAGADAQPNYSSMEGYLAAKVFAEGLRRAGRNPSRDALVTALESIQNANFGGFRVDFGAKDHVASQLRRPVDADRGRQGPALITRPA